VQNLGNYVTHNVIHNVMWYSATASNVCTVLKTPASTESNHHSTNVFVVKDTVHTRLEEIRAKATVIALATFDIGHLKNEEER